MAVAVVVTEHSTMFRWEGSSVQYLQGMVMVQGMVTLVHRNWNLGLLSYPHWELGLRNTEKKSILE